MKLPFIAAIALCATPAFAQCPSGACVYYAPIAQRYAVAPCQPVQTCEPVQPCEPVAEISEPEPCAPVATCEPVAETCESVEACEIASIQVKECPTGACPLRAATRAAVKTATTPVRAVVSLLDRVNATRARYGLPALQYDASLEAGARSQAAYCSQVGTLVHGSGAEILAQNNQGVDMAINQWLASPGHRSLLLGGYRYAGVSVVRDRYGRSWCAMRFR